jgi:hypothetical protein
MDETDVKRHADVLRGIAGALRGRDWSVDASSLDDLEEHTTLAREIIGRYNLPVQVTIDPTLRLRMILVPLP